MDWGKGIFNTTSKYEGADGKKLIRRERFLLMQKQLI
jgi:hypothetical protein